MHAYDSVKCRGTERGHAIYPLSARPRVPEKTRVMLYLTVSKCHTKFGTRRLQVPTSTSLFQSIPNLLSRRKRICTSVLSVCRRFLSDSRGNG